MPGAAAPRDEVGGVAPEVLSARRLAAVHATGLLDSEPEGFDDLARLAAAVAGGQRAFITVVDERRSFILARSVTTEIGLRQSLEHANEQVRTLQESLLPDVLPAIPGLETAAAYLPSGGAEVSGGFYDLFAMRDDRWGAVLGDVCGKGVQAAKVTALARYTLRAEASRHLSPAMILDRLNHALIAQQGEDGRFLTAAYATFRTSSTGIAGRLCTGGHPPALLRRADGRIQEIGQPGTLLGFAPEVHLADVRFRLGLGDTLLLYSDGITEARRGRGPASRYPMYGQERLAEVLASCPGQGAQAILDRVCATVQEHTAGQPGDDTALLVLHVPAIPAGAL